jgi:hypothetical protein
MVHIENLVHLLDTTSRKRTTEVAHGGGCR